MKLYSLALLVSLALSTSSQQLVQQSAAPTPEFGTVWTAAHSPYRLKQSLTLKTLTIEAGVTVIASQGVQLSVTERLVANGTAADPIVFTSTPGSRWAGLYFYNVPDGSSLTHCHISRAQKAGVRMFDSAVTLIDCEITNNGTASASWGGGVEIRNYSPGGSDVVLRDCYVAWNRSGYHGGGISAWLRGNDLILDGCRIENNVASASYNDCYGGGIDVLGTSLTNETLRMTDCVVEFNRVSGKTGARFGYEHDGFGRGGGIYVSNAGLDMIRTVVRENEALAIADTYISYAQADADGGGLYCSIPLGSTETVSVKNSLLAGNTAYGEPGPNGAYMRGGGIYLSVPSAEFTNCTIVRNRSIGNAGSGPIQLSSPGIHTSGGNVAFKNSILFSNSSCLGDSPNACSFSMTGPQLAGSSTLDVSFCNVQGGWSGLGNFSAEPIFVGLSSTYADLSLQSISPSIDEGDPDPAFQDVSFPPSQGGLRNDQGMNGGPLAGGWLTAPVNR